MTPRIRTSHWKQASALVPLAVLSGGWTVLMAVSSAGASPSAAPASPATPSTAAIEAPASLSRGITAAPVKQALPSSTTGIPAAALAAYQRAAQVMSTTDPACNLSWPLLAAIGRVESDHGRYGGSVLSADGVARPGIVGVPLDGSRGTARIHDSDAGMYDGDATFDRAVGPMQFIPTTWAVAGVDGDGDQKRNPQDIDDAALAAAVYLCSGSDDLATENGVNRAVFRYNHSHDYVSLVKSIADGYAEGSWSTVPTATYSTVSLAPYSGAAFDLRGPQPAKSEPVTPSSDKQDPPATKPAPEGQATAPAPVERAPQKKSLTETVAELPDALEATVQGVLDGVVGLLLQP